MKKKKFKKQKRDWKKHPDLYDYTIGEKPKNKYADYYGHAEGDVSFIKNIVHGFGYDQEITSEEKMMLIEEVARKWNRDYIEGLYFTNKILAGKVKPRNAEERRRLKEHKKSEEQRKIYIREQIKEQKKQERFEKLMDKR